MSQFSNSVSKHFTWYWSEPFVAEWFLTGCCSWAACSQSRAWSWRQRRRATRRSARVWWRSACCSSRVSATWATRRTVRAARTATAVCRSSTPSAAVASVSRYSSTFVFLSVGVKISCRSRFRGRHSQCSASEVFRGTQLKLAEQVPCGVVFPKRNPWMNGEQCRVH